MKKIIIWLIFVIILIGFFVYLTKNYNHKKISISNTTSTTSIDKNFESTTTSIIPDDWLISTSTEFVFRYPDLANKYKYITAIDWPPLINFEGINFNCNERGGSPYERAGQTKLEIINNRQYCITEIIDGAAGNIYHEYAYSFQDEQKTIILTFTFDFPQCMNYDNPKQNECKNEEDNFDISNTINLIVDSIKFLE